MTRHLSEKELFKLTWLEPEESLPAASREHLKNCRQCREAVDKWLKLYRDASQDLRDFADSVIVSDEKVGQLFARICAERRRRGQNARPRDV